MIVKACKENGIILYPNVKSDKFLLLDDDGNEFYINKSFNMFYGIYKEINEVLQMKEIMKIKLQTINDVKEFVNATIKCPFQVDVQNGRFIVDGKSIMGLFSLNLSDNLIIKIPMTANKNYIKNALKKWEVSN